MDNADYRRLLIAFLITEHGFVPDGDTHIEFGVDIRYENAPILGELVIEDLGIDPGNGIYHQYALLRKPRTKKAAD